MTAESPTVAVTGSSGFLGWHVRCQLATDGISTVPVDRRTLSDADALKHTLAGCDAIVHCAGINRDPDEHMLSQGNVELAERLGAALAGLSRPSRVIYTNSVRSDDDTSYGRGKREAGRVLEGAAEKAGLAYENLCLPNLFGEYGRPNYNSVVATFAANLAHRVDSDVRREHSIQLLDVAQAARWISEGVQGRRALSCSNGPDPVQTTVGDVFDILERQHKRYVDDLTIPDRSYELERRLFDTLRSHLHLAGHYPFPLVQHADARGAFFEACRADGVGQTSISTSAPGVRRGEHFHMEKVERFLVLAGTAEIRMRRLFSSQVEVYRVDGTSPVVIDMPTRVTHDLTNVGDQELITLFWAGDLFDRDQPDTWSAPVDRPDGGQTP